MSDDEFQALYESVVAENSRRTVDWDGVCREAPSRDRRTELCACGMRFRGVEDLRVHIYPQLRYGRDPTFRPKVGDVIMTKAGVRWTILGQESLTVMVCEDGREATVGLGTLRLQCGLEYGGSVVHYTEDPYEDDLISADDDPGRASGSYEKGS
jgi:hypothetical protein